MRNILIIVLIFFVWRILLFLSVYVSQKAIPVQKDSIQYTIWAYPTPYPPVNSLLLYPLANFDGVHYLTIAGDGKYREASDGRFFPFYPLLIFILNGILGGKGWFQIKEFFAAFSIS